MLRWELRKQRFDVQFSEALELQRRAMWNKAAVCYSNALKYKENDVNALLGRSRCYVLMGKLDLALLDAEAVICEESGPSYDRLRYGTHRGLLQKADTLYARGDFEEALLCYHSGHTHKSDVQGFRDGIKKAEAAIFASLSTHNNNNNTGERPQTAPIKGKATFDDSVEEVIPMTPKANAPGTGNGLFKDMLNEEVDLFGYKAGLLMDEELFRDPAAYAQTRTMGRKSDSKTKTYEYEDSDLQMLESKLHPEKTEGTLGEFRDDIAFVASLAGDDVFSDTANLNNVADPEMRRNNHNDPDNANIYFRGINATKQTGGFDLVPQLAFLRRKIGAAGIDKGATRGCGPGGGGNPYAVLHRMVSTRRYERKKHHEAIREAEEAAIPTVCNDSPLLRYEAPKVKKRFIQLGRRTARRASLRRTQLRELKHEADNEECAALLQFCTTANDASGMNSASRDGETGASCVKQKAVEIPIIQITPCDAMPPEKAPPEVKKHTGVSFDVHQEPTTPTKAKFHQQTTPKVATLPVYHEKAVVVNGIGPRDIGNLVGKQGIRYASLQKQSGGAEEETQETVMSTETVQQMLDSKKGLLRRLKKALQHARQTGFAPNISGILRKKARRKKYVPRRDYRAGLVSEEQNGRSRDMLRGLLAYFVERNKFWVQHMEGAQTHSRRKLGENTTRLSSPSRRKRAAGMGTCHFTADTHATRSRVNDVLNSYLAAEEAQKHPNGRSSRQETVLDVDLDEERGGTEVREKQWQEAAGGAAFSPWRRRSTVFVPETKRKRSKKEQLFDRIENKAEQFRAAREDIKNAVNQRDDIQKTSVNASQLPFTSQGRRSITPDRCVMQYHLHCDGDAANIDVMRETTDQPTSPQSHPMETSEDPFWRGDSTTPGLTDSACNTRQNTPSPLPYAKRRSRSPGPCFIPSSAESVYPHNPAYERSRCVSTERRKLQRHLRSHGGDGEGGGSPPPESSRPTSALDSYYATEGKKGFAPTPPRPMSAMEVHTKKIPADFPHLSARSRECFSYGIACDSESEGEEEEIQRPSSAMDDLLVRQSREESFVCPTPPRPSTSLGRAARKRNKRQSQTDSEHDDDWVPINMREVRAAPPPTRINIQRSCHSGQAVTTTAELHTRDPNEWRKELAQDDSTQQSTGAASEVEEIEGMTTSFIVSTLAAIHSCIQCADLHSAVNLAEELLEQMQDLVVRDADKVISDLCGLLGTCHLHTGDFVQARTYFTRQLVLSKKAKNKAGYDKAVSQLSCTYQLGGTSVLAAQQPLDLTLEACTKRRASCRSPHAAAESVKRMSHAQSRVTLPPTHAQSLRRHMEADDARRGSVGRDRGAEGKGDDKNTPQEVLEEPDTATESEEEEEGEGEEMG